MTTPATNPFENSGMKTKNFWQRPEGVTGTIFLVGIVAGLGYLLYVSLPVLIPLMQNILYLSLMLIALAAIVYMVLDPKMRNLVWYMYKSVMRWVTGLFVQIDPIGILKSYVDDLKDSLGKMSKQIGVLRGQMRKIQTLIETNNADIQKNMQMASVAKKQDNDSQVVLATRKAARLQESNEKYSTLLQRMEILYRILDKMYKNSEILLEDTQDQVKVKEQEYKAIKTSHSAMKSAMSIISGDPDKRAMFDMALEHIADDLANKVGEMERFMDLSSNFMASIDLQNGVFEEQGLKMLEEYEKQSSLLLMPGVRESSSPSLDLDTLKNRPEREKKEGDASSYDNLFN
jgi:phage shock protein A